MITKTAVYVLFLPVFFLCMLLSGCGNRLEEGKTGKDYVQGLYGENQQLEQYDGNDPTVRLSNGIFIGKETDGVISYKGIPYAEQPVGELRWKRVGLPEDNDCIYEAYYFGKSGIQTEADSERASYYPQGEDCLTLNVWVNQKNTDTRKPVMVFIHGGAYGWGGTADPLYDGTNLISKFDDIILITVNYRIGLMGFLDLSPLQGSESYRESGNLGLLDQITALQWIQKNAAAFGGDPENVTLVGESAGAGSVLLLSIMPAARGLFRRVIAESGSPALTFSREEDLFLTEKLMDLTGARSMDDLLALSEEELMELNESLNDYNNYPERDGVLLPEDLQEIYNTERSAEIDFLIGTNADEAHYWIHEVGGYLNYALGLPVLYESNLKQVSDQEDQQAIREFMQQASGTQTENLSEFFDEIMFRIPAIRQADQHAMLGGNVYMYYWIYPSAITRMGACHAVELAYVFNNLEETIYTGDNIDPNLADLVQEMWVNFVRTGCPDSDEIQWPKYQTDTRSTMIFDTSSHVEKDPLKEQRVLLTPLITKYVFGANYASLSLDVPVIYNYATTLIIFLLFLFIHMMIHI